MSCSSAACAIAEDRVPEYTNTLNRAVRRAQRLAPTKAAAPVEQSRFAEKKELLSQAVASGPSQSTARWPVRRPQRRDQAVLTHGRRSQGRERVVAYYSRTEFAARVAWRGAAVGIGARSR